MDPKAVIPAKAGIQGILERTGFRLFASLGRNDGGVESTIHAKVSV